MVTDNIAHHFERVAVQGMDRFRGWTEETEDFLDRIELKDVLFPGADVLELGSGVSNLSRYVARKFDIVPHALDLRDYRGDKSLEERMEGAEGKHPVIFQPGNIQAIPYPDNTFHFVFSYRSFMYLPDPLQGLVETHRVMKPGAFALIDVDGDRKEGRGLHPQLNVILQEYPNGGQVKPVLSLATGKPIGYYIIHKTSTKPLEFPELAGFASYDKHQTKTDCSYLMPIHEQEVLGTLMHGSTRNPDFDIAAVQLLTSIQDPLREYLVSSKSEIGDVPNSDYVRYPLGKVAVNGSDMLPEICRAQFFTIGRKGVPGHNHEEGELYYVTDGYGKLVVGSQELKFMPGQFYHIPHYGNHAVHPSSHTAGLLVFKFSPEFVDRVTPEHSFSLERAS